MACGRWYRCCYRINPTLMWGLIQAAIWSHLLWLWLQYGEVGYSWTHTNKTNLIKMKMFPWHSMRDKAKTVHSYKFIHILLKQKTNQWIPVFFFGNRCRSKKTKKTNLNTAVSVRVLQSKKTETLIICMTSEETNLFRPLLEMENMFELLISLWNSIKPTKDKRGRWGDLLEMCIAGIQWLDRLKCIDTTREGRILCVSEC